jgi:hypothetical protein
MLLSIEHPSLLPHLKQLGYGLLPVAMTANERFALVIKATKEAILTARLNNEIKVYLLGDNSGRTSHIGFITAFFDDHDEPIVLKSPQFSGDEFLRDLGQLFCQEEFDLYFFDEHDRELLGVRAHNPEAKRFSLEISHATFPELSLPQVPIIMKRLENRFSIRDAADDEKAFTIKLGERLYPDDFLFIDGRDEAYRFNGADESAAITSLERESPGQYQERDIAVIMGRIFHDECIYLNPIRDDTGKELTDVMVVTHDIMMFIQAKDSPNTEAALRRSIERERSAIRSHIEKAARQLRGALSYAQHNDNVMIRSIAGPITIPVEDRQLFGVVIVREMFDDDYPACSAPVLEVVRALEVPSVLLDYSGLHIIAQNVRSPVKLVNGLYNLLGVALDRGEFPKPVWNGPPGGRD